jgi:phosphoglycolate phosphatase
MNNDLKNKFDSIIFDLDGTLWDSTITVAEAWQKAKTEVDYITDDITPADVQGIAGMAYDAIFEKLFPYLSTEQRQAFKALCAKYELELLNAHGGDLYPDLKPTLDYLSGKYKLFVVSNCQCGYIELFLTLNNLESTFLGHQCYGTKSQPKYLNIIDIVKDHGLQNPVYVGDTQGDLDSSIKAGLPMIYAAYGFGEVSGEQIADIQQFGDLKELL